MSAMLGKAIIWFDEPFDITFEGDICCIAVKSDDVTIKLRCRPAACVALANAANRAYADFISDKGAQVVGLKTA